MFVLCMTAFLRDFVRVSVYSIELRIFFEWSMLYR